MKLILVRHGQTHANTLGALDTAFPGDPLNVTGLQQADELQRRWVDSNMPRPDVIATSTLTRTQQTARPLANYYGITPLISDNFREVDAGNLEMSSYRPDQLHYLKVVTAWMNNDWDAHLPGAPTGKEIIGRFTSGVAHLAEGGASTAVVFCHGAIIRLFCATQTTQAPPEMVIQNPVPNAHWTVFDGEPGNWQLLTYAERPIDGWSYVPGVFEPVPSQQLLEPKEL